MIAVGCKVDDLSSIVYVATSEMKLPDENGLPGIRQDEVLSGYVVLRFDAA